ncbi:hypothetical protein M5689_006700 [Euphorbia peplus]|nr:hypothetical protein M5689_006700 [Euphorbia peplus]
MVLRLIAVPDTRLVKAVGAKYWKRVCDVDLKDITCSFSIIAERKSHIQPSTEAATDFQEGTSMNGHRLFHKFLD